MSEKPIRIVTHSGAFQPDDIFAVASLKIVCGGEVEIVRSREPEVIASGDYVVDVGGVYDPATNRFDHHQVGGAGKRDSGLPYSAFGLVWKHFGEHISGNREIAEEIEKKLVQAIDADDNGIDIYSKTNPAPYGVEHLLYSLRPTWAEKDRDLDQSFLEGVEIAEKLLRREVRNLRDRLAAREFVEAAYQNASDKRIIVLEDVFPSGSVLTRYPEPLFTIKPERQRSSWKVKALEVSEGSFKSRKLFPEAWAGKQNEELQKITGVPDAIFCHKDRWVAGALSKEGAIALARVAVEV